MIADQAVSNTQVTDDKEKPLCCILSANSKFRFVWNLIVIILLAYTSTIAPF